MAAAKVCIFHPDASEDVDWAHRLVKALDERRAKADSWLAELILCPALSMTICLM